MHKKKIVTIVGTRPEIIKLSEVIKKLDKFSDHTLIHTGQNYDYELNEVFFSQLNIRKPDFYLGIKNINSSIAIGNIIIETEKKLKQIKPDAVLIYGDTNSCLSIIPAKKNKIPIFHMEAGNRCFDQLTPEESNRKIVDHLSDINMTISEHARRNLINEGIRQDTIIKVGSSMYEVIKKNENLINKSKILKIEKLNRKKYFIVSIHREENVDDNKKFLNLLKSINHLAENYKLPIIISTHPRTKKKLEELKYNIKNNPLIKFSKPYGFHEYMHLQKNAFCTISDSGTITEESSILNSPAITIRNSHERPEGMDNGVLIMSNLNHLNIIDAVDLATSNEYANNKVHKIVNCYLEENLSGKVIKIIFSYIDFVNRYIWFKQ